MKKIFIALIAVVAIAIVVVAVVILWPGAPDIPADHEGRNTCLGCHETGAGGAPKIPQWHLDRIQSGALTDNVTACQKCHDFAGSS